MNELVSIIILNYNGKQFLGECLSSVLKQQYSSFELILFDNNSTDGSCEYVKEKFTDNRIKIIHSDINLGFAGGNNEALKHCSGDLVVLLNNDTVTRSGWLESLVNAVKDGNTVASSFVITEGIPEKYYRTNGSVSYMMYNIMNVFPAIEDVFYPNGCSVIFRQSEIGVPFDSDYFFYGEDVYLGLKARFKGMKIKFVKDSVVDHKGSSTNTANTFRTFCRERNRFLNLYTFFSVSFIIKMIPYITFNHTLRTIQAFFSRDLSLTGVVKAYLWFYFNLPAVLKKRRSLKEFKLNHENNIIKYMSSKVLNTDSPFAGILNSISYMYSRLTGIKPVEYYQNKENPL